MGTVFRCGVCRALLPDYGELMDHKRATHGRRPRQVLDDVAITQEGSTKRYEALSTARRPPGASAKMRRYGPKVITSRGSTQKSSFSGLALTSGWAMRGGLPGLGRRR